MAKLYLSSASALGKASYSYMLINEGYAKGRGITHRSRIFAEYKGLNEGLRLTLDKDVRMLKIFGPKLMIDQLNGIAPIKSRRILPLYNEAKILLSSFRKVKLAVIPHTKNKAFPLATEILKEFFEGKAIAKSKEIPDKRIMRIKGLKFAVGKYIVDLGRESCSCEFFSETNSLDVKRAGMVIRCQHIFAIERFISR